MSAPDEFDPAQPIPHETALSIPARAAIGLLFAVAGSAEIALSFQLMALMSNDLAVRNNIAPLVAGQNISVKLGVLRTILETRVADKEKLSRAVKRLDKMFDKRNLFAHGLIKEGHTSNHVSVIPFEIAGKERVWANTSTFEIEQILAYAREIRFRVAELESEFNRLGIVPSTMQTAPQ